MKDKKLLKSYRGRECIVCGDPSSTAAHIQSKGSGGGDEEWNLLALCFEHHRFQHDFGWHDFVTAFPQVLSVLNDKGWILVEEFGRFRLRRQSP